MVERGVMRPLVVRLLFGLCLVSVIGCSDPGADPNSEDPCAGVVCRRGQDCIAGKCVDRGDPTPEGCQTNADCLFHPDGELCDRQTGRCVACFTDGHCPKGRSCEAGRCEGKVCTTDADCGEERPYCNEAGDACLACRIDAHCTDGLVCVDGECAPPPPACKTDEDCEDAAAPHCGAGECVACLEQAHCPEGEGCAEDGSCQPNACEGDDDCAIFPGTTCRDGACRLGQCDVSADCTHPEWPYCENNVCVRCTATQGCGTGETCVGGTSCLPLPCESLDECPVGSVCEDGGCRPADRCEDGAACLDPRAPHCVDGTCVACAANAQCGAWEICDDGRCVPIAACGKDADCAGGFVCEQGGCVACRADADCPRGVCREGTCVNAAACVRDAQCASGVCAGGRCVACGTDADCPVGYLCEAESCVAGPACGPGLACPPGEVCDEGTCTPVACEDDDAEPDAGPAAARPLPLRQIAQRSICPGDEDWFVFTAAAGAMIDVSLVQGPEDLELLLVWFEDDTGRRRRERRGSAGMLAGALPPAYGGRYYVVVRSTEQAGAYALLVEPAPSCRDGLEPNDLPSAPRSIEAGRLYEGLRPCNLDHYVVDLPANHAADFHVFYENGLLDIEAFDGATFLPGTVRVVGDRGGGRARRVLPAGTDRQILFRVLPGGTGAPTHYGLYVAVEPALACEDGPELLADGVGKERVQGTTSGSTLSLSTACGDFANARTYAVTLEEDRRLVADLAAEFEGARLALFDASCSSEILCYRGAGREAFLDFAGLPAGSYLLAVGADSAGGGWYDLTVRTEAPLAAPANDRCEDATHLDLSAPVRVQGSTVGARIDFAPACGLPAPDVFYDFELDATSRVIFEFESAQPHALVLIESACGDPHGDESPCWEDAQKELLLPEGTYRLGVLAASGRGADFDLGVKIVHTPENDRCEDATPILTSAPIAGDTTWAHDDSAYPLGQSCTGYLLGGHDVFYAVDLLAGQTITIRVAPAPDYDVAVYVRPACDADAACLAGRDAALKGGEEVLPFTAPEDGTYYIVVDGAVGGGAFEISVE